MRAISRRAALTGALGLVGGAVLGSTGGCANPSRDQTARLLASTTPLPERFTVPFVVPPVKHPVSRAGGASAYEIVQRRAVLEILPGRQTEVLGYDGLLPGPTIVASRGEQVTVTHRNELDLPTVVHLHGGHTAAASDGYPTDLLLPAGSPTGRRPRTTPTPPAAPAAWSPGLPTVRYPKRPAGRDAVVPRPPDGLHRTSGLARARRLVPDHRRCRGGARPARAVITTCR